MDISKAKTGVFRRDIVLIRQNPLMLFDPQADAYFRISEKAARVTAYMTESMPLTEFRSKLQQLGIDISPEELWSLTAFLQQNNLLEAEYGQISLKRQKLAEFKEKSRLLRWSSAYMYFRLPPLRPEKFFEQIAPYVSFLASKFFLILLMIPAAAGFLLVLRDFAHVRSVFIDTLSWAGAAKYFAAILFLKIIHEAAHSLAAIRFKCRVRGIGIGFMVFYPRMYTDTTDSWQLPRRQRLLIDAAGVIAELLVGGIAALLYFYLPPGAWKSTMFYIFAVSTVSTLLVNGNPCIRYDGYYILCDLTGIDNLMSRSGEYVKQWWRYRFLRLGCKPQEKHGWFLLGFGAVSFVYRIFLYTAIILVIYHKFIKVLAVILLAMEIFSVFIYPCLREIRTVRELSRRSAGRARWLLGTAVLAVLAGLLFLPLNWSTDLPGMVVAEKSISVVVSEGGILSADLPEFPVSAVKGETLLVLHSELLDFAEEKLRRLRDADQQQYDLESVDEKSFARSAVTAEKIASDEKSLLELSRRRQNLTVRSPVDGTFVVTHAERFRKGRFLPRGTEVGMVVSGRKVIYAYADDRDAASIRPGSRAKIIVSGEIGKYDAVVTAVDPVALPVKDSPLLQVYGGSVPMYQSSDGADSFHSVRPYCRVELAFDGDPVILAGRRVVCEIEHQRRLYDILSKGIVGIFRREF